MKKQRILLDHERLALARERLSDWYEGRHVHPMPYLMKAEPEKGVLPQYSFREMIEKPALAVEQQAAGFNWHYENGFRDCDWLPCFSPVFLGQGLIPSMFGAAQHIVDNHSPFTEGRLLKRIEDVESMPEKIDPEKDGWGPRLREVCMMFLEAGEGMIPIGPPDHQSPYGTATKLISNETLMLAIFDAPELFHRLMTICTDAITDVIKAMEKWVGAENMARNATIPVAGPGSGIIIWDDYISVLTPGLHKQHCSRYNMALFRKFGRGHLHTCGPYFEGYIDAVLHCRPVSVDVTIMRGMGKSQEDMLLLREITKKHGIKLNGSLSGNAKHQFSTAPSLPPDEEFLKQMADGGLFWTETGDMQTLEKYAGWANGIGG